ncbi:MAG: Cfr10I/Bse634I family restriction endonuclease, partial [Candidatus Zixiibacteriota bacterium]
MNFISYVSTSGKPRPQIDKLKAFCFFLEGQIPPPNRSFSEIIEIFDSSIRKMEPVVSSGALNNCHGDWYEWLLALAAWNVACDSENSLLAVRLPNVAQFDVGSLYEKALEDLLQDLRKKLSTKGEVELITSNPDFAIIDRRILNQKLSFKDTLTNINENALEMLDNLYKSFVGKCEFNAIKG